MEMIQKIAYDKYQLHWMIEHGHSIDEIILGMRNKMKDAKEAGENLYTLSLEKVYEEWLEDDAFRGSCFVCFDEFMTEEYRDVSFMYDLLTEEEFDMYLRDLGSLDHCTYRKGSMIRSYADEFLTKSDCVVDVDSQEVLWVKADPFEDNDRYDAENIHIILDGSIFEVSEL